MNSDISGHHISVSMASVSHNQDQDIMDAEDDLVATMSEDEDSLGEDDPFTASDLLNARAQNDITSSLTAAGTMPGLAAAAAVGTHRKRQRPYKFETNPSTRKRQSTRLIRKLKQTMHEFCTRCGQQAVLLCVSPGKDNPSFKVFGASPLDLVLRSFQSLILRDLERVLQEHAPAQTDQSGENLFELPPLVIDGIPTPVDKMNQAQLRMFVPEMLKYSTGRGKPGWGKELTRPVWWPLDVPWANVRRDVRTDDQKLKVSWTQALRQIVKNCYKYHGRDDLLHCFSNENSSSRMALVDRFCGLSSSRQMNTSQMTIAPPTLVQTVQNSDGSVSLVQLDSGQTIATITQDQTGTAVATLTTQDASDGPLAVTMHQVNNGQWSIATSDPQTGISGIAATVAEGNSNDESTLHHVQPQQVVISQSHNMLKCHQSKHQNQQTNSHSIGITFNSSGQAVATIQNARLTSGTHISLSEDTTVDDNGSAAMVQIPVSVYEKIASSIQDADMNRSVRRILHQQMEQDKELDLSSGQDSCETVSLGSLQMDT